MTDYYAPIGLKRTPSKTGDVAPVRTDIIGGKPLVFYSAPPITDGAPPWVETRSLFDIVGLAEDARQDFIQRNGLDAPGTANIVFGPTGRIFTLAPGAAWLAVFIAQRAGAISAETAGELKVALGID